MRVIMLTVNTYLFNNPTKFNQLPYLNNTKYSFKKCIKISNISHGDKIFVNCHLVFLFYHLIDTTYLGNEMCVNGGVSTHMMM